MARVKKGFSGLNVPDQFERARDIHSSLLGNADFPTPNPSLADFLASINALEQAYIESRNRDKVKVQLMKLRRVEMLFLVNQMAAYVQEESNGDQEKILSTGFDVIGVGTPHPVVAGEVHDVRVYPGSAEGKQLFKWRKATDAIIYMVEVARDLPNADFELKGYATKTRKEVGGLTTGDKYRVRVTAIGREEKGPHSDEVSFIAAR